MYKAFLWPQRTHHVVCKVDEGKIAANHPLAVGRLTRWEDTRAEQISMCSTSVVAVFHCWAKSLVSNIDTTAVLDCDVLDVVDTTYSGCTPPSAYKQRKRCMIIRAYSKPSSSFFHLPDLLSVFLKLPDKFACPLLPLLPRLKPIEILQSSLFLLLLLSLLLSHFLSCRICPSPSCDSNEAICISLLSLLSQ